MKKANPSSNPSNDKTNEDEERLSSLIVERDTTTQLTQDLIDAFYLGTSNFLLAYNTRAGIAVLLRIFTLIQKRHFYAVMDLSQLLDEKHLSFRVEAVSFGLFAGWSTGGYRGLKALVPFILKRFGVSHSYSSHVDQVSTLVASSLAVCSIGFVNPPQRRRSLALYAFTRALQCAYNMAKQRQYWHFWGSTWDYGDSLLFALASAQVMYAFIMRPLTLPHTYFRFIQHTGPVEMEVLEMVRNLNRQTPLSVETLRAFMKKRDMLNEELILSRYPQQLSCRFVHSSSTSCTMGILLTFQRAFTRAFPLYLSLFIVPSVVLRFKRFVRQPFRTIMYAVMNATRSNAFVASFCALYMALICLQRRLMVRENRFLYYMAGLGASITILIEPKHRRSELALYVLPRALDSLYMIMNDRRLLTSVRHGEIVLFSLSMTWIMYCYEHEQESMSPFFYSSIKRFMQTTSEKLQHTERKKSTTRQ